MKAWRLRTDGKLRARLAEAGAAAVRCQARFMEMTRDKVKVGDASTRQSGRFHLSPRQPIIGYDGSTPATRRSRRQRKGGEGRQELVVEEYAHDVRNDAWRGWGWCLFVFALVYGAQVDAEGR